MIPRKRLQVLLYILQIFYVFGDGGDDPGSESLLVSELPDNVLDDSLITTKPLLNDVYEKILFPQENSSNSSQGIYNPNHPVKEDENLNVLVNEDADNADTNTTIVKNVTIKALNTSLHITWTISGDNATSYLIDLYFSDKIIGQYNTTYFNYTIKNLEPCSKYKVWVRPYSDSTNYTEIEFVEAETIYSKPGEPSSLDMAAQNASLNLVWQAPYIAPHCIKEYRITVDTESHNNRHFLTENTKDTKLTFKDLYACSAYAVSLTVVDINNNDVAFWAGKSPPTLPEVSTPPLFNATDKNSINITKDSTSILWDIENKRNNCTLIELITICNYTSSEGSGYELLNGNTTYILTEEVIPKNVTMSVKNLSPFTNYVCMAQSLNEAGYSNWSLPVKIQTSEDTTSIPQNFYNKGYQNSKLLFVWEPPKYIPGKIQNYRINFTWDPSYPVPDECNNTRSFVVDTIDATVTKYTLKYEEAYSHYLAKLSAKTAAGWSQEYPIEFDSTTEGSPDEVTSLSCEISPNKINSNVLDTILSWKLPCSSRGFIHYFDVSVYGTRENHEDHNFTDQVTVSDVVDKNELFSINFGELRPLYNYMFEVSATLHGFTSPGNTSSVTLTYPPGIPPQPELDYIKSITLDPHKARRTTSSAAILLPLFPTDNGDIKYYAIMVSGAPFDNASSMGRFDLTKNTWPDVSSWEEAMEQDFHIPYQATEPRWTPIPGSVIDYGHMKAVKFVVGEDTTCPQVSANTKTRAYCNGPLKSDTWYEVRMRAFTNYGYRDSVSFTIKTNAELNVGLVLGVVFGILFIGIVTTLMLLVKRCTFRVLLQRIVQSNIPESPVPNPFTRRKFINHCQQLAENPGKLSNEFQLLQTLSVDLQMPSNTACLQANRKKNRYSDILPYDFSRVKLEIIDNDPNSDYINASFIRGYSGTEEYIACQGPKEDTTYDFWRMIDQYDVKMIIMLTQLVERGKEKCHQYYPTIRETFTYEKLSIRCTSELDYRTYTHRTLVLQKEDKKRTITHLHFKDWPDHDVPDDFDAMIHFCQIFRKQFAAVKGLSVIHCSAGIGRTGTLIAIDILLQSIRDNRKLDVFGTVYRLRRHRLNMVQRESQYAYIYNCIRQVLKNPYFLKTYKPPPIDPIYSKTKTKKDRSDSSTDLVTDSNDTLRKNSLSTSVDSMQPLCQSSPQTTPRIQMNVLFAGLRYCKSTSAIDTRSNHNRIGRYNSEGYAICESARDSFSTTSKESVDENDVKSSSSSIYENVEPLIRPSSSQTIAGSSYYLTNDSVEKDTSL